MHPVQHLFTDRPIYRSVNLSDRLCIKLSVSYSVGQSASQLVSQSVNAYLTDVPLFGLPFRRSDRALLEQIVPFRQISSRPSLSPCASPLQWQLLLDPNVESICMELKSHRITLRLHNISVYNMTRHDLMLQCMNYCALQKYTPPVRNSSMLWWVQSYS